MKLRVAIVVAFLAAAQLTVGYVKRGYTLGTVEPPKQDLTELPKMLGPWSGEDRPVDERIQEYLQSRSGVDRVYRNRVGDEVSAHVVWTDDYIKIHFPQQCYRESGWHLDNTKNLDVDFTQHYRDQGWAELDSEQVDIEAGGETFPCQLLTFERDGRRIHVLYWFQMGDEFFFDRIRHRNLRRQVCWGNREWPPLVKVMLESPASSTKRAEDHLRSVAGRIYAWMQDPEG